MLNELLSELSDASIAVLANTVLSLVTVSGTTLMTALRFFHEKKMKRIELYTNHRHTAFRDFIAAYSDLHAISSVETQREFLKAWRTALSVSEDELFDTLMELSFMDTVSTIKPSGKSDEVFSRCVRLISEDFSRNISRHLRWHWK